MRAQEPWRVEAEGDLLERGYSRRSAGRILALLGSGAALAAGGTPAWAAAHTMTHRATQEEDDGAGARTRIGLNECWTGPLMPGQTAAAAMIARSNRYNPSGQRDAFLAAVKAVEGAPPDHVAPWPGSSDPLSRAIVSFCSPTRGVVTGDPTFELAWTTAEWLGAPLKKVPLTPDDRHDVKAMLAADPNAGLYYVCSPNNPTGTVTPLADIEWMAKNKPADSVLMVDEAYIHFAGVPSAIPMALQRSDVVVLRTFSKLFGMAGMRLGYCVASPERLKTMMRYDGSVQSGSLPMPTLVCGTASLTQAPLIAARRAQMEAVRDLTIEHVKRKGLRVIEGSRANMFMIDWKTRPAKAVQAAFREKNVDIGRSWAIWPTVSRITVGSKTDMEVFRRVLDEVV